MLSAVTIRTNKRNFSTWEAVEWRFQNLFSPGWWQKQVLVIQAEEGNKYLVLIQLFLGNSCRFIAKPCAINLGIQESGPHRAQPNAILEKVFTSITKVSQIPNSSSFPKEVSQGGFISTFLVWNALFTRCTGSFCFYFISGTSFWWQSQFPAWLSHGFVHRRIFFWNFGIDLVPCLCSELGIFGLTRNFPASSTFIGKAFLFFLGSVPFVILLVLLWMSSSHLCHLLTAKFREVFRQWRFFWVVSIFPLSSQAYRIPESHSILSSIE